MTIEEIEDILLIISEQEENEKDASKAFTCLYRGYSRYLGKVVANALKERGIYDEHLFNAVINNTFHKLYLDPLSFSFKQSAKDDKSFKGWLAVVAKNELKKLINEYYDERFTSELVGDEAVIESIDVPEEFQRSINQKTLYKALKILSERDKHILRTLYLYYEEGKKTPSTVLDRLCRMHDTTKDNIRQIKRRSESKIIEYFAKNTELKPLKNAK